MIRIMALRGRSPLAWLLAALLLITTSILLSASEETTSGKQAPSWSASLPSSTCPWSSSDTYCHRASPVLADVTEDGKLEIVVATNRGHVQMYRYDGKLLWDRDVAPAFGMSNNRQRIASSPAVADIDNDGRLEIVVGTGTVHRSICTQGGVIVLEHTGQVKSGWPFLAKDGVTPPNGCHDTIFATPALGDLDKDGDMEIVFGGFDKRIYAVDHRGKLLPGFPPNSFLHQRFGWENLRNSLADTIWSSPALGDLDGDGYLDIVIGTDEGNFDDRFNPPAGWGCPYRSPSTAGYCGGSIYALDRFGRLLPGFPRYKLEIIQSTPALVDIDDDGRSEMFVGTGDYYFNNSPDKPSAGFRLFAMDSDGRDLPGWSGGKKLGNVVQSAPALGDIDGDKVPEVVVTARDKKLYAFELDGRTVSGFPMTPRMHDGQLLDSYSVGSAVVLADYTGDGNMEIFVRHAWETVVVDGQGKQLTARGIGDAKPAYVTTGTLWNSPAVGDLDGDGRLELVAQNSKLNVWKLPQSSNLAHWPMFKQNAARTSSFTSMITVSPDELTVLHEAGRTTRYMQSINVSTDFGIIDWELDVSDNTIIKLPERSGSDQGDAAISVAVRVPKELPEGTYDVGHITLTISRNNVVQKVAQIPVEVTVVKELGQQYLPHIR